MPRSRLSRRNFLKGVALGAATVRQSRTTVPQTPQDWDAIFESYVDSRTGTKVYNLTPGAARDTVVYQTHPMWTPGCAYLLFYSDRTTGALLPHALDMAAGEIRPVVTGHFTDATLAWNSRDLYWIAGREILSIDLVEAFHGRSEPRRLAALPPACLSVCGGMTVDAAKDALYFGGVIEEDRRWGIFAVDLDTGLSRTAVSVGFRVGHLQANPFVPRQILFCHETGGDAPQRTWVVRADGTGLRPFFKELNEEWVTHEVWWGRDRAIFTIWPYDKSHTELAHGVAWASLESGARGELEVLSQYPAWHTHGSPDGRWAMGDDFDRNLWLVHVASKQRKLLTQGHLGAGFDTHPHGSFSPDGGGIVFNSSRFGAENIFYVELPPWDALG